MNIATILWTYPRAEFPFIREFLEYHSALGINKFVIGLQINSESSRIEMTRRPAIEFVHQELSEKEVVNRFKNECYGFNCEFIEIARYVADGMDPMYFVPIQIAFCNSVARTLTDDWIAIIDMDEFIVSDQHLTELLNIDAEYATMQQVRAPLRWDENFNPRSVLDIDTVYDMDLSEHPSPKYFIRPSNAMSLKLHRANVLGKRVDFDIDTVHFRHFKGLEEQTEPGFVRTGPQPIEVSAEPLRGTQERQADAS